MKCNCDVKMKLAYYNIIEIDVKYHFHLKCKHESVTKYNDLT